MRAASRATVISTARAQFESGGRLDMLALAAELGIGRTTLYRRVGDRDAVLGEILAQMSAETMAGCVEHATGEGSSRALDALRRFMWITSGNPHLSAFLQREPDAALRVIITTGSPVFQALTAPITGLVTAARPEVPAERVHQIVDVIIQVGMVFLWANIATDAEPQVDRALAAVRIVLEAS